jgi:hypothetical protein
MEGIFISVRSAPTHPGKPYYKATSKVQGFFEALLQKQNFTVDTLLWSMEAYATKGTAGMSSPDYDTHHLIACMFRTRNYSAPPRQEGH